LADARVVIDPTSTVGDIDERLFGGFIEHMGRAVYGGIYEPGHPTAGADGWRGDVIDLVRRLGVSIVRYPGGNFVSGYDWEDGVGPRAARPTRTDLAWRSIEPNLVGTDDFIDWARLAGVEPMLAVNLGTRGAAAARALVEYANGSVGTPEGDRRIANGHPVPHGVHVWCLGNEMDGPWQIGAKTAVEYGRLAAESATAMRTADPSIELVACGSSGPAMPTFGAWEATVLDLAWDVVDHISLHAYVDPAAFDSTEAYLAGAGDLDRAIGTVGGIIDTIARGKGDGRRIGISVDEWNVWRLADHIASRDADGPFRRATAIAEDRADVTDALVVGSMLLTLLRHADRVRIACVAQLVNAIPLIRTHDGGPAWLQPTAYPFADVAGHARGTVLRTAIDGPRIRLPGGASIDALEIAATHDPARGSLAVFVINRATEAIRLDAALPGFEELRLDTHAVLDDPDPRATNTADEPERVVPRAGAGARLASGRLTVDLPARSWSSLTLSTRNGPVST
jgi:alpha-L-arabinofuranosidase